MRRRKRRIRFKKVLVGFKTCEDFFYKIQRPVNQYFIKIKITYFVFIKQILKIISIIYIDFAKITLHLSLFCINFIFHKCNPITIYIISICTKIIVIIQNHNSLIANALH
jgi:hypothetical protein